MKRICWGVAFLFACVFAAAQSQSRPVTVHVHVVLVDSELNQKPVPFLNVTLKGATSSDVKTRLDGGAEITVPPGIYTVITAKPVDFDGKRYSWSLRVTLTGTEKTIDLTNDNAKVDDNASAAPPRSAGASSGDLTEQFKKLKNTVVTVISESGHGTGFFVDGKGLVLTNQHVVAQSQYLAVQFDREHKIAARLIASDAQKDVALLWVNMSALPSATPAVLARSSGGYAPVQEEKFDVRLYYLNAGDFEVALPPPPFDYREKEEGRLRAERTQKKRNRRDTNSPDAAQQDANSENSPRDWESETGGHRAVFGIYVVPKVREGFGSALSRSLRNGYGAANLKFKTDFQSMKLFCGVKEVQRIHPERIPLTVNVRNASVKLEDSTYKGAYFYPPDAVSPQCGTVKLAIYSSKSEEPVIKTLDGSTTARIWADFDAFRRADAEAHSTQAQK